ncbi:g828 [Coccomyxa elongata]
MPTQLARLDEDYSHELNLRVFNQTIVLCTRHLNEPHAIRLAAETLKYMFPAGRLAIVERDVQLNSGLTEIPIDVRYVLLVEPWLYQQHMRFFQEVASQISMQGRVAV